MSDDKDIQEMKRVARELLLHYRTDNRLRSIKGSAYFLSSKLIENKQSIQYPYAPQTELEHAQLALRVATAMVMAEILRYLKHTKVSASANDFDMYCSVASECLIGAIKEMVTNDLPDFIEAAVKEGTLEK